MSSDTSHFHRLPFATVLITFFEVSPVNAEIWRMYLDVKAAWNPTWPFTLLFTLCKTSDIWNIMKWHKSELKRSDSMRFVLFTLPWLKQIWVTWAKKISDLGHICLQCEAMNVALYWPSATGPSSKPGTWTFPNPVPSFSSYTFLSK